MVKTEPREIDGHTYTVTQLPPRRAMRLLRRLAALIAPAFGGAGDGKVAKFDFSGLASALGGLRDEEFDLIVNELLAMAQVDGKDLLPIFDLTFQGALPTLFKVLGFALEVQYGDFFGDRLAGVKAAMTARLSPASTTSLPSGPSGG